MQRVLAVPLLLQQRVSVDFCVKIGMSASATMNLLRQAYGGQGRKVLSERRVRFWYKAFQTGHTRIADLPRTAKPKTGRSPENIAAVRQAIRRDRRMTVAALSRRLHITQTTVYRILKQDLKMVRKAAKFVPKQLTDYQKRQRQRICELLLRRHELDPKFFSKVVTMDEAWIYQYDPETKVQSTQWLQKNEECPHKFLRARATGKLMLVSFFDSRGLLYYEIVQNRTVNKHVFCNIVNRMRLAFKRRRPKVKQLWLHMDNVPTHKAVMTQEILRRSNIKTVPHPPYSPDLAPSDFWFYAHFKKPLRGIRFGSLDELEGVVARRVGEIPSHLYKHCVNVSWPKHWLRCVARDGGYFEGLDK